MTEFYKYQAAGNDFVIIKKPELTSQEAEEMCDRHFGIGADGILVHFDSQSSDAGMKIFNSDGSIAKMCGNGIRCFAAYLVNECGFEKNPLFIETGSGILEVKWKKLQNESYSIEANIGKPELKNRETLRINDTNFEAFTISTGNPHIVLFPLEKINPEKIRAVAGQVQKSNSLNTEVNVEIITDINIKNRSVFAIVKEKGAGFTLACGTGGAAIIYSLFIKKTASPGKPWKVFFPGGEITYTLNDSNEVLMKGVPEKVFRGTF